MRPELERRLEVHARVRSPAFRMAAPKGVREPAARLTLVQAREEAPQAEWKTHYPGRWRLLTTLLLYALVLGPALTFCALAKQTWALP